MPSRSPIWFIARVLFKADIKSRLRRKKILCEESLILISARTEAEARLKAKRFARASQHSYRNVYKEKVFWKFVELRELQEIIGEKLGDGVEVHYRLFHRMASTLASRKARADFRAFDKLMRCHGGKKPRAVMNCLLVPRTGKSEAQEHSRSHCYG